MTKNKCYMGDSAWWDNRFKNRKKEIMSPEKRLEQDSDFALISDCELLSKEYDAISERKFVRYIWKKNRNEN